MALFSPRNTRCLAELTFVIWKGLVILVPLNRNERTGSIMRTITDFFATIWKYWKKLGQFIGDAIGRVFLMVFYVTIVLPFGIGLRLFGDPLDTRDKSKASTWRERSSPEASIDASYNQF
jgi:hypothetical protein